MKSNYSVNFVIGSILTNENGDKTLTVGPNDCKVEVEVRIDNDESLNIDNNIEVVIPCDWVTHQKNANKLVFFIEKNKKTAERYVTVVISHVCDSDVVDTLLIRQSGQRYTINCNENNIQKNNDISFSFDKTTDNILNIDDVLTILFKEVTETHQECIIPFTTTGGSGNIFIKNIIQYTGDISKLGGVERYKTTTYDKGLFTQTNNRNNTHQLVIRNYGRTFVDERNFYRIVIGHSDNPKTEYSIKVRYEQPTRTISLKSKEGNTIDTLGFNQFGVINSTKYGTNTLNPTTDTVFIDFGDTNDYGYTYELLPADTEWCIIKENPTSITVDTFPNYNDTRNAIVKIKSIDDENKYSDLKIIQEPPQTRIVPEKLFITQSGDFNVQVYGPNGINRTVVQKNPITSVRVINTTNTYTDLVLSIDVSKINTTNKTFTIESRDGKAKVEITYTPSNNVDDSTVIDGMCSGNNIIVTTSPEDVMIVIKSTGKWCNYEYEYNYTNKQHNVKVICDSNNFKVARKCRLIITSTVDTSEKLMYEIEQQKETSNFVIKLIS